MVLAVISGVGGGGGGDGGDSDGVQERIFVDQARSGQIGLRSGGWERRLTGEQQAV